MFEQTISVDRLEQAVSLFGSFDQHIKTLEKEFSVSVINRGSELKVSGEVEDVGFCSQEVIGSLLTLFKQGRASYGSERKICYFSCQRRHRGQALLNDAGLYLHNIRGKPVKRKNTRTKKYIEAIKNNTIVFGVGPAGTGKTYLAVAMAVTAFRAKEVNRIVLTRPVEAGESLGFLPGDLQHKVDPYLRPLYDALFDMLGAENFQKYQERGNIEVAFGLYARQNPRRQLYYP